MSITTHPIADPWQRADPYERYMGRWSRRLAPGFLAWLALPGGLRWLDVGCGTGALSQAILSDAEPAALTAVDPSPAFVAQAGAQLGAGVECRVGSAQDLPLPDAAVDACVSSLVLNFVPDPEVGLREMARVTAPGGWVGACVWDYAGRMDMIRAFWDAAAAVDPAASALDEGRRFPLCRPEALRAAFGAAGLHEVRAGEVVLPTAFDGFDDLWQPFLGGQGPAPGYLATLDPPRRDALRERLRATFDARQGAPMQARAWTVCGRVAAGA